MQIYFSAVPQSSPKHCHFHYPNSLWGHYEDIKRHWFFLGVLKPEMRPWNRNKQKKNPDPNNLRTSQFQGIPKVKAHGRNATSCISILFLLRVPDQVKSIAAIVRKLSVIRRPMPDLTRERIWFQAWTLSVHGSQLHSTATESNLFLARGYSQSLFCGHYVQRLCMLLKEETCEAFWIAFVHKELQFLSAPFTVGVLLSYWACRLRIPAINNGAFSQQ